MVPPWLVGREAFTGLLPLAGLGEGYVVGWIHWSEASPFTFRVRLDHDFECLVDF